MFETPLGMHAGNRHYTGVERECLDLHFTAMLQSRSWLHEAKSFKGCCESECEIGMLTKTQHYKRFRSRLALQRLVTLHGSTILLWPHQ